MTRLSTSCRLFQSIKHKGSCHFSLKWRVQGTSYLETVNSQGNNSSIIQLISWMSCILSRFGSRFLTSWRLNRWNISNKLHHSIHHKRRLVPVSFVILRNWKSCPKSILYNRLCITHLTSHIIYIEHRGRHIFRGYWRLIPHHISNRPFHSIKHSLHQRLIQLLWCMFSRHLIGTHHNIRDMRQSTSRHLCMRGRFECIFHFLQIKILGNILHKLNLSTMNRMHQ